MKILLLDNYDSFTYNLAHALREIGSGAVDVVRNDKCTPDVLADYTHLVLSPGPGIPSEAGNMPEMVKVAVNTLPVLGVCLGHQAIGEAFGGKLINLEEVVHGKEHEISVETESALFSKLPEKINVGRYHSWVIEEGSLPKELKVTGRGPAGEVMAIEHESLPVFGVQFHPESVMTETGNQILKNWVSA